MANSPVDQKLSFDTELSLAAVGFTGLPSLVGTLQNEPVVILFKNQTNQSIFISDQSSSTIGTTMVPGETFVLDCRSNAGKAVNMGFSIGTPFYATVGTTAVGFVKISVLYAH